MPAIERPRSTGRDETIFSVSQTSARLPATTGRERRNPRARRTTGSISPHRKTARPMTPTKGRADVLDLAHVDAHLDEEQPHELHAEHHRQSAQQQGCH